MPDSLDSPLRGAVKYNPHLWDDDELRAVFVVRHRELVAALDRIRACPLGKVPQHLLITGYRGMGKTTLLRRIALAVADDSELAADWIPLTFPEEQYTVSTLAELWMNVLDTLADRLERQGATPDELADLDAGVRKIEALSPAEREGAALGLLQDWTAERQQRLLLLIDSSDLLLTNLGRTEGSRGRIADAGATPLWRLRKTLTHDPTIFWLGASYQALEAEHQYQYAFHDFFEILELRPLKLDEMRQALLALARVFGAGPGLRDAEAEQAMQHNLDTRPERLRSLRTLTGGNPRTTVVLYELLAAGWEGDVHSDLKALLDLMTPLYKARMEQLAEQPRKLLALLMEHWDPIGAGDLARIAGLPPTTVSGQLSRLTAEGLVEKVALAATSRAGYQASERLFNIWYLMRYTPRRTRRRLTWLVEFMRLWFSADDLRRQARRSLDQLRAAHAKDRSLDYALALSDALPEDCEERHLLEWSLYSTARRRARRTHQELAALLPELFDAQETGHPLTTAEDYLRRFEALDEPLSRCPHATGVERRDWIAAVKGSFSLDLATKERIAEMAANLSEQEYKKLLRFFEKEIENPSELYSSDDARWMQANILAEEGYEELYQVSEKGIEDRSEPGSSNGMRRIRTAILAGDYFPDCPDPKVAYRQILTVFGEAPGAFKLATDRMAQRHQDSWTEKLYRKSIELDPNDARPWNSLGILLGARLDRPEEAETAFRKSIELDPKYACPWNGLGYLLRTDLNRPEEAEAAYRKSIELDPKDAWIWNDLGYLLYDHLNRPEEAEAAYRQVIELDPKNARSWNTLGYLLQDHLNRPEEAEAAYRKSIELDPKDAWIWNDLGYLLQDHLNRPEEAKTAYRNAIELDPKNARSWNNLGKLLCDMNRFEEAEDAYRNVIALDPENAWSWNSLGILLNVHLHRLEEAENAFRKSIELDPKYAPSWNNLGNLLCDMNRSEEAEKAYRNAIRLDPEGAWSWHNLGKLLQDDLKRPEKAEAAYRKASELDPEYPYPLTNLGRLLVARGDAQGADVAYRRVGSLATKHAGDGTNIDYVHLILQAQLWLDNRDAAGQALERLAAAAATGDKNALFRLQEQARECHAIGRGPALADLLEASPHAELLRPIALALRAADQGPQALDGVAAEIRTMAEESLKDIRR
ncbi:tetratricopeptide repeat protein [Candidatus Thiosymbion oneisti]|uniref:tetratricopeptide repeat protein n=1 Tax=Candidatus Thiosymbion oneisti TaxID=589554 RepID=UPI000ACE9D8D|nr:tetratricopeptide repeat protein [Candidatus Thiosymbion oneisti]